MPALLGKPGVARIGQAWGRLREHRAPLARPEPLDVEVVDLALLMLLREPRLPTRAVVHRHIRGQPPRVLGVEAEVLLFDVQRERRRLPELEYTAEHEIGQGQARLACR